MGAGVFEALLDSGVLIVATSNRAPWDLNNYGVHEVIFNHFKQRLLESCTPVRLDTADFRMVSMQIVKIPLRFRV
jgi:predicted ATPase